MMRDSGSVKLYWSFSPGLACFTSAALFPSAAAFSRARCSIAFLACLIFANRVSRRSSSGDSSPRGDYPRSFAVDPGGHYLCSCNQRADAIACFRINRETGTPAIIVFLS